MYNNGTLWDCARMALNNTRRASLDLPAQHPLQLKRCNGVWYSIPASGCFHKLGVHVLGVSIVRARILWLYVRAYDFW